ncbi:MAG TPA: hypothetical protein PLH80_11965 [Spirochaetota bacterium]|nr:hypothetical protein [Spirochaetota bacterium]HQG43271.1 hypothetical protein [Spirochaetota bacterium]HQI39268.1 hypothetical protein [Spirochaetota bacterium]HQK06645.1 hypothetical protein [Spirochaetota bacterium]
MISNKYFWYVLMSGALVLWAFAIALIYLFPEWDYKAVLFIGLIILHGVEIPYVLTILRKDVSTIPIAIKTFLFGFTWWLPVKKGILQG